MEKVKRRCVLNSCCLRQEEFKVLQRGSENDYCMFDEAMTVYVQVAAHDALASEARAQIMNVEKHEE